MPRPPSQITWETKLEQSERVREVARRQKAQLNYKQESGLAAAFKARRQHDELQTFRARMKGYAA